MGGLSFSQQRPSATRADSVSARAALPRLDGARNMGSPVRARPSQVPVRARDVPGPPEQVGLLTGLVWRLLCTGSAHGQLEISQPGDTSERDADELAGTLTECCGDCAAGRPCASGGPGGSSGKLQRQHDGAASGASVAADVREVKAGLGGGQPLNPSSRQRFEQRSGVRLDGVRIHTDERAAASARAVGALAYTLGSDVVFAPGRFAPHTIAGERLLAHEIAHVLLDRQAQSALPARLHRQAVTPAPAAGTTPPSPAPPATTARAASSAAASSAPSATPSASAVPPAMVAANKACVAGSGPGRPSSKTYPYRGVQMSTDPEFMRWEMRLLIRWHGLKGGDMWFDALRGRGFDLPLPFSAHARAYGGLQPRTPIDAKREMEDNQIRAQIGPAAVALATSIYPEVRQEAVNCLSEFQKLMRATLETVLVESERRLETQRILYGVKRTSEGPGGAFEAKNTVTFQGLVGAAKDLLAIRNRITPLRQQQMGLMVLRGKAFAVPESNKPRYDALQVKIDEIEKEYDTARAGAALRYPVLGAILDDSSRESASFKLERLARGELTSPPRGRFSPPSGTAAMIGNVLEQPQSSINTVRKKVDSDPDKLWSIAPIVSLTRSVLGTRSKVMADKLVDEKLEERAFDETIKQLFLGALALVLALPTGGGSLAVGTAVAGAALSGYQALQSISKYQLEMALTSTDLDKRAYAISTEEPSALWVALDVVVFVPDAAQALKAVRALRGPARDALLAKEGVEAQQTAERLAEAADNIEGLSKPKPGQPGLGQQLLDRLAKLRKQPTATRALGAVGESEAKAVVRSGETIAKEAADASAVVSVLGHDVKVTRSGHIVICTECTWLRERFARELADRPALLDRMSEAEREAAKGWLDAPGRVKLSALTKELQQAREARLAAEVGPLAAKVAAAGDARAAFASVLARRPAISKELGELEQALASATKVDPSMVAKIDNLQARLAQLHEIDAISKAPRNAQILEVSADEATANYYKTTASTVPGPPVVLEFPDGSRIWRDTAGGPIRHEATLGKSVGRAGMERDIYTAAEHGNLPPGPKYQRAHSLGQGTGFESPYGVFYAPEAVNQTLQNHGIEAYMRDLAATARPGETFRVLTKTTTHSGAKQTLRMSTIDYTIVRAAGGQVEEVATYSIRVTSSAKHPLVTAGALRFSPTAAGQAISGRVPLPDVLTKPFSFSY